MQIKIQNSFHGQKFSAIFTKWLIINMKIIENDNKLMSYKKSYKKIQNADT